MEKSCFNCFFKNKDDVIVSKKYKEICDDCVNHNCWKQRTYCQYESDVSYHLAQGTLKSNHTRKQLAEMLRTLEPHLVEQSENACRSMCKKRICKHLKFIVDLHNSDGICIGRVPTLLF